MLSISDYKGSELSDHSLDIEFSIIDLTLEQLLESNFHLGSKLSKFEKLNFSFILLFFYIDSIPKEYAQSKRIHLNICKKIYLNA